MISLSKNKTVNSLLFTAMGLIVICMLSSFINRVFIAPPVDPILSEDLKSTSVEVIQVNVLNASGKQGLAAKVKDFLRNRGFDVVEIGNNDVLLNRSQVIDRLGDTKSAKEVAYALGINDSLVISQPDSNMYLRASIIIGDDFAALKPFK